jgi:hypothetical protein
MKKRRREAIYIPNQAEKNPSNWHLFSEESNESLMERVREQKRREKAALKNK